MKKPLIIIGIPEAEKIDFLLKKIKSEIDWATIIVYKSQEFEFFFINSKGIKSIKNIYPQTA